MKPDLTANDLELVLCCIEWAQAHMQNTDEATAIDRLWHKWADLMVKNAVPRWEACPKVFDLLEHVDDLDVASVLSVDRPDTIEKQY